MKRRVLSLVLTLAMAVSLFAGMTVTAAAEGTASSNREELTTTTTKTLEDGKTYYITGNVTINGDKANKNGLVIGANTTVTLEIPAGMTLTVYGQDGYETTGGGAAILLPQEATLIVAGSGKLVAVGGKAGNGSTGGSGGRSIANDNKNGHYESEFGANTVYFAGSGGTGGNGGGGAGAGIGTNGGAGGSGSGSGGSGWRDDGIRDDNRNGYDGNVGASGISADASGNFICAGTIDVTGVTGGSAGSAGSAGSRGSDGYDGDNEDARGIAGGAGGGGGGGGLKGAAVGTGGGGGGQGGGGGSAGYIWGGRYVGGGGGGGGQGSGTSGGGAYGSDGAIREYDCDNDRVSSVTVHTSSTSGSYGSINSYGNGGSGAYMTIKSNSGTYKSGKAGSGARGGSSGSKAIEYEPDDASGKYILLLDWSNDGGDGDFSFTEGTQTLSFDLNTQYWKDAEGSPCDKDSFYYILCDKDGNPIEDSNGNAIGGPVTFDDAGNASIVLPEGLNPDEYTLKIGSDEAVQGKLPVGGFDIKPKVLNDSNVTVNFVDDVTDLIYNGNPHTPAVRVTHNDIPLDGNTDYDLAYSNNTDAGSDTASVTVTFKGNYDGYATKTFSIAKYSPTITIAEEQSVVYDREPVVAGTNSGDILYTYSDPYNCGGAITVKWYADNDGEKGAELTEPNFPKNVGTYWIGVSAAETSNYNAVAEVTQKFTITPYVLQYGDVAIDPTDFIYNANGQGPAVTVKHGIVTLVKDSEYSISNEANGKDAGTYIVTVTGIGNYSGTVNKTWNINKVTPEVIETPSAAAIFYGHTLADSELTGGTVVLGSTPVSGTFAWADPTIAPAVADSNTTAYNVVFTPNDRANYNAITCTITLTVIDKKLEIINQSGDAIYGEVYNISYEVTYTNLTPPQAPVITWVGGSAPAGVETSWSADYQTLTITTSAGTPTGTYGFKVTVVDGPTYEDEGELTVIKRQITAAGNDVDVSIGDADISVNPPVYNGEAFEPEVELTCGGKALVEGEDYDVSYSNNTNAGTASVTITFKGNYSGTITEEFTIAKCDPTLSIAEKQSTVYSRGV